ncbi:hypothetical protein MMC30_007227 [Trapelia coarctata]|nr:hypothetical protein [Trapelia coarctata]
MWTGVIMAFSIFSIATNAVEISMFRSRKLNTRTYLISQWAKGAAAGVVWVIIEIFWFTGPWYMKAAGSYSVWNFVFQHPAILAGLYYASRAYSKYGGDAGADGPSQSAGEAAPLLMDHDEEV